MYLDVATTTVDFLLVLDGELKDKTLSFVGEGVERRGGVVETCVHAGLNT